jgi:hypothetical protein
MAKKEESKDWFKPTGPRSKIPPITDDMVIKNQEALKKQKEGQKSSGKLFWEKKK